jgi:hypothetical protein
MKRKTLVVVAAVAALAALVVLTTGAGAGTAGRSDQPGDGFAAFVSCLASHGVQVPSDDPVAVKEWLADRYESDPAVRSALEACAQVAYKKAEGKKPGDARPGPTAAQLVSCLEQHGVDVPGDAEASPVALKRWLSGALDQPSVRAALDVCVGPAVQKGTTK